MPFVPKSFFWDFYENQKKETVYVVGTLAEWRKLAVKGEDDLMLFIIRNRNNVSITRNKIFLAAPTVIKHKPNGLLKNCRYLGDFQLDEQDTKTLKAMYPNFCFKYLSKYVRLPQTRDADKFNTNDMFLMQKTEYNKIPLVIADISSFFISNNQNKKWFQPGYQIFYKTSVVDIPEPLNKCEDLSNKNVLPIKKLVKDIGDLDNLFIKETKNFFYVMIVI